MQSYRHDFTIVSREKEWNLKCFHSFREQWLFSFHSFREWKVKWKCLEIEIKKWNLKMPRDRDQEVKFPKKNRETRLGPLPPGEVADGTFPIIFWECVSTFLLDAKTISFNIILWITLQCSPCRGYVSFEVDAVSLLVQPDSESGAPPLVQFTAFWCIFVCVFAF